jgi:polyphenol oxidase
MGSIRHLQLALRPEARFVAIPLRNDGNRALPLNASLSLHRAGHMGRDTEERRHNRSALLADLGIDERRVFGLTQVHSRTVSEVTNEAPAEVFSRRADGLVTARRDVVLTVTAADCLPVWIVHPEDRVRALVHSGWQGTGIVRQALAMIESNYGLTPGELTVVIGPGIGACCYAVNRERHQEFVASFGEESGRVADGRYFLDLRQANLRLLEQAGVREIDVIDNCTCCDPLLGSYRRDGKENFHNMLALFGEWARAEEG